MSSKNLKTDIALNDLKPGMFVVKLDIPWLDSPFIKNSRLIKSNADIEKLRKAGVKVVTIDLNKGAAPEENPPQWVDNQEDAAVKTPETKKDDKIKKPNVQQEMAAAEAIREKLKATVSELNSKLERELPIDCDEIIPLIDQTLESLDRNNQALLSLAHLSRKSQKLADHCFSTFCLALSIERCLKLNDEERNALGVAALLHETGWLQLPLQLMGKRTRYTATEKKLVESHTANAVKMLQNSNVPELSLRIISEHHERLDGSGYPHQLQADAIHKTTKILSVADFYDESVHQLADCPGTLPTNALRKLYIDAEKGIFDSEVVAALIGILGIYPVTSAIILNTGERAVVEEVHPESHLSPIIVIHYDKNHRPLNPPLRVNLRDTPADGITRMIETVFDPHSPQNDPARRMQMTTE